jgi:PAS domain S-box-containing protein
VSLRAKTWLVLTLLGLAPGVLFAWLLQTSESVTGELPLPERERLAAVAAEVSSHLSRGRRDAAHAAMARALSANPRWWALTVRSERAGDAPLSIARQGPRPPGETRVISRALAPEPSGHRELALELRLPGWGGARVLRSAPWAWSLGALLVVLGIIGALFEVAVQRPIASLAHWARQFRSGAPAQQRPRLAGADLDQVVATLDEALAALKRCEEERRAIGAERENVRGALVESEERYSLAVRGANDGLWEWNLRSGEVYYSPRWKSMLGYAEAEIGTSPDEWRSRVHPEDLGRVLADVDRHLSGATPRYMNEHRLRHRDGSYRWVLARGTAIRNAAGKPYRMLGLHTDVTERKRAEETLRLVAEATSPLGGEPFFCALVRNFAQALDSPFAFVTECLDRPTTRVRTLAFWAGEGFSSNIEFDLIGTPCEEVIVEGKMSYIPCGVAERYPRERELGMESYLGVPIFDSSGQVIMGHLAFFGRQPLPERLVSSPVFKIFAARAGVELEWLQRERALEREKSALEAVLAAIPDGLVVLDADGRVDRLNRAAEQISGWREAQLRGEPVARLFPAEGSAGRLAEDGSRCTLLRRDGQTLAVRRTVKPMAAAGMAAATVMVFRPEQPYGCAARASADESSEVLDASCGGQAPP